MPKKKTLAIVPATGALAGLPSTQPPPRKADIICALVERARVKHEQERAQAAGKIAEAEAAIQRACIAELSKNPSNFEVSIYTYHAGFSVKYAARVIPPHIKKLIDAERELPRLRNFDAAQVKRAITAKMVGGIAGDRVKALLASPEAVKKLDETLEALAA